MDHIRLFDWNPFEPPLANLLTESDLDNCVTRKILHGTFVDPDLLLPENKRDEPQTKIDWNEVLKIEKRPIPVIENQMKSKFIFAPGLRALAPYPKLSAMTLDQHYQSLKVLCAKYPHVQENFDFPKPTRADHKLYKKIQEVYETEQKEYLEWAKTIWLNKQSLFALKSKPIIEQMYDAEFQICFNSIVSLPKKYILAAQIPLHSSGNKHELVHKKNLILPDYSNIPQLSCPMLDKKFTIMKDNPPIPQVCNKHSYRFILPNEKFLTSLPIVDVQEELAGYACAQNADFIVSENALKCLVEQDESWLLPVSVHKIVGLDGKSRNICVISDDFSTTRHTIRSRTYKAFRQLLHMAFTKASTNSKKNNCSNWSDNSIKERSTDLDSSSDDEIDNLVLDIEDVKKLTDGNQKSNYQSKQKDTHNSTYNKKCDTDEIFTCTCQENAPNKSFKAWQLKNNTTNENIPIIIHCSHTVIKENNVDTILEPIPEYQLNVGGTALSDSKIKSLALSLFLRKNATLINVRVDAINGDVVTYEYLDLAHLESVYDQNLIEDVSNTIGTSLTQLQGLLPGNYILQHKPNHGHNALLFVPSNKAANTTLDINVNLSQLSYEEEVKDLQVPPKLGPVLLPYHKRRKILPLAFSPFANHIVKETKLPPRKSQVPPKALKCGLSASTASGKTSDGKLGYVTKKWPKKRKNGRKLNT